jgi:TolB-like protein
MCGDVAGYSRLMHGDETATHHAFRAHWDNIVLPAIEAFGGRVVKSTGDGFIAEFASAIASVESGIRIQSEIAKFNERAAQGPHLRFRIGIAVGEIIIEANDVYGDRVNIAARIQEYASEGGICISGTAGDEVKGRLPVRFQSLGKQKLKNIREPVQIYRVLWPDMPAIAIGQIAWLSRWRKGRMPLWRVSIALAAAILFVLGLARLSEGWWRPASLSTNDKPSVAVLAFDDLDTRGSESYFGDGIAEDITTELARQPNLLVIARNSAFSYKGDRNSIREIAQGLAVRYVLEGSVRRDGDRIRVNAQLVDAANDVHVWADRYDRRLNDIFDIQDDITHRIVSALALRLVGETASNYPERSGDVRAYELYMDAMSHLHRVKLDDTVQAIELLKRAVQVDPDFARADAGLAWAYLLVMRNNWQHELGLMSIYDAESLAAKHVALALRRPSALAYRVGAELNFREGLYDKVSDDIARARALEPNDADAIALLGRLRVKMGEANAALDPLRQAIRLDPNQPLFVAWLGVAEFARDNYTESVTFLTQAFDRAPDDYANLDHLIAADAYLGRIDLARATLTKLNSLRAQVGAEPYTLFLASKSAHYGNDCDLAHLIEGLKRAGVPAGPPIQPPLNVTNCARPRTP